MMSWDAEFDEPVPLPLNKQASTLREAADYVMRLPKSDQDSPEWQAAVSALLIVAEHKSPSMVARIGMMQALNRGKPPAAPTGRKDTPWGRGTAEEGPMKEFTLEEAMRARSALRDALEVGPETFPLPAFVGMLSDEIEQMRRKGRPDADIAAMIGGAVGKPVTPEEIAEHYATSEERHR